MVRWNAARSQSAGVCWKVIEGYRGCRPKKRSFPCYCKPKCDENSRFQPPTSSVSASQRLGSNLPVPRIHPPRPLGSNLPGPVCTAAVQGETLVEKLTLLTVSDSSCSLVKAECRTCLRQACSTPANLSFPLNPIRGANPTKLWMIDPQLGIKDSWRWRRCSCQ
jgi:hypothetical protein